jgi:hypothetical protein
LRRKYTNYDALHLINLHVKDDKIRFPFIASCVLTGSFTPVYDHEFHIGDTIDDRWKIYFARGVFNKLDSIFSKINQSKEEDVTDLINKLTDEHFIKLEKEIEKHRKEDVFKICSASDLYTYSLRFGIVLGTAEKDAAIKETGQRIEQIAFNLYKKMNFEINPNKRTPQEYNKSMKEEAYFLANVIREAYEKYMG